MDLICTMTIWYDWWQSEIPDWDLTNVSCPTIQQLINNYNSKWFNSWLCYSSDKIFNWSSFVSVWSQSIFDLFSSKEDYLTAFQGLLNIIVKVLFIILLFVLIIFHDKNWDLILFQNYQKIWMLFDEENNYIHIVICIIMIQMLQLVFFLSYCWCMNWNY